MDKRGKKIIYLSHCLINQNLRFPGIAVESGALTELLVPLIKKGIGIEPLPCLERLGWGGVRRQIFFKYFPMVSKNIDSIKYPIIRLFLKIWIRNFKKLCRKEAKKIVNQIQDYHESGHLILGIITTNDSPTCGFTKTINFLEVISKLKELGIKDEFENPTLEIMKDLIPRLCENGSGFFMIELLKQMKKSRLDINIIGFNIWNNLVEESERVLKQLDL